MQARGRVQEFGIEHLGRHHLAAPDQPDLIGAIIGDRAMPIYDLTEEAGARLLAGLHHPSPGI